MRYLPHFQSSWDNTCPSLAFSCGAFACKSWLDRHSYKISGIAISIVFACVEYATPCFYLNSQALFVDMRKRTGIKLPRSSQKKLWKTCVLIDRENNFDVGIRPCSRQVFIMFFKRTQQVHFICQSEWPRIFYNHTCHQVLCQRILIPTVSGVTVFQCVYYSFWLCSMFDLTHTLVRPSE